MALGRIAFEPVNEPGLGRAEGEPVAPSLLQSDKELPAAVHRLVVQVSWRLNLTSNANPAHNAWCVPRCTLQTFDHGVPLLPLCDASATGGAVQCQHEQDIVDPPSIIKLF